MKPLSTILLAIAFAALPAACTSTASQAAAQAATPSIVIYHAEGRRSERIVWLCEELGLDYELKLYLRRSDNAQLSAVCPPMVGSSANPPGRTLRSFSMIRVTISGVIGSI